MGRHPGPDLYLVFILGGWQGIYRSDLRSVTTALAAVTLLGWALLAGRHHDLWPRSALIAPLILCLGAITLATITSRYPRQSIDYDGYALLLIAMYLLLVTILRNAFLRARVLGHLTIPPFRLASERLAYGNPATAMTVAVRFLAAAAPTLMACVTD